LALSLGGEGSIGMKGKGVLMEIKERSFAKKK
jgi:hypothetical protein